MPDPSEKFENDADITVERNVMVTMRDGVRLATDLYRPAQSEPADSQNYPVLLERTPYDKTAASRSEKRVGQAESMPRAEVAAYFVRHGYIVAYQDCRG
ncbi:MAG: antibiotic hydrolase, partial [Alphaproteobacteria bacterium]|nr:antibiotic hydrolase [Alphaproteobacteria bacterium]